MLKEISNNNTDVMNADASGLAATKAKTGAPKMQEKSETIKAENIDFVSEYSVARFRDPQA